MTYVSHSGMGVKVNFLIHILVDADSHIVQMEDTAHIDMNYAGIFLEDLHGSD